MRVFVGIDLGSTTTKALILDEGGRVLGRGITNSRSDYHVASGVAREQAFAAARFGLVSEALAADPALAEERDGFLAGLDRIFRLGDHRRQLARLRDELITAAEAPRHRDYRQPLVAVVERIVDGMEQAAAGHFGALAVRKSDFFRDLAAADYVALAGRLAEPRGIDFELLSGLFDQAILPVESSAGDGAMERVVDEALAASLERSARRLGERAARLHAAVEAARAVELEEVGTVGTGYGRARLPFPKEQIRSEILCHGLGAHALFPGTRTVLDIGGQDTKAIQVDADGIVTGFQMNDRCAAGCGRYLGYNADEMSLGLHELGPLAQQSTCRIKINSTCTVFAGAELRERLSLGQRREDILAGLHRAIILRALSLLARSGGIEEQFTFTGGVARNPAAVAALAELVEESYGRRTLNISPDSIYTGALGAALFARRAGERAA